jgi:hypothetical protein
VEVEELRAKHFFRNQQVFYGFRSGFCRDNIVDNGQMAAHFVHNQVVDKNRWPSVVSQTGYSFKERYHGSDV